MMKTSLALILVAFPLRVFAGEVSLNCDSRIINEKACQSLLQTSLKEVGCESSAPRCILHPWGSDFVKSWICSVQSSDCSPLLEAACPEGSSLFFDQTLKICRKSKNTASAVQGVCEHQHAAHSVVVSDCTLAPATCAKFGGTPLKCTQPEGHSDQWEASCGFPNLRIPVTGSSCLEMQSRCELINTEKGVKGSLISCLKSK